MQLASELIAVQEELGQINEVAELLGQFTCKTWLRTCQQKHRRKFIAKLD